MLTVGGVSLQGYVSFAPNRTHACNVPSGRWVKVQGKLKMEAHQIGGVVMDNAAFKVSLSKSSNATALRAARARSSSSGAMGESSGKAQDGGTPN